MSLTRANAKALNLVNPEDEALDAFILFSDLTNFDGITWDYDFTDGEVASTELDFMSVATHELGHVLGFVSNGDNEAWVNENGKYGGATYYRDNDPLKEAWVMKPTTINSLDFFRYSDDSAKYGLMDLSHGQGAFFSIDNGATKVAEFSTGKDVAVGGDGFQASHWKNGSQTGIMDPSLKLDQIRRITDTDLMAMDAIGYDLKTEITEARTITKTTGTTLVKQPALSSEFNFIVADTKSTDGAETSDAEDLKRYQDIGARVSRQWNVDNGTLESILQGTTDAPFDVNQLTVDSSMELDQMLTSSKTYDWGFSGGSGYHWGFSGGSGYHWGFSGGSCYHMDMFFSEFSPYFSTIDLSPNQDSSNTIALDNNLDNSGEVNTIAGNSSGVVNLIDWDDQSSPSITVSKNNDITWNEVKMSVSEDNSEITFTEIDSSSTDDQPNETLIKELVEVI